MLEDFLGILPVANLSGTCLANKTTAYTEQYSDTAATAFMVGQAIGYDTT
jgi:hypothetical protein